MRLPAFGNHVSLLFSVAAVKTSCCNVNIDLGTHIHNAGAAYVAPYPQPNL